MDESNSVLLTVLGGVGFDNVSGRQNVSERQSVWAPRAHPRSEPGARL